MALADPVAVTYGGNTYSMPRVSPKYPGGGTYRTSDGGLEVNIRTLSGAKVRHQINLIQTKFTTDPYRPSENRFVTGSVNLSLNFPNAGFTAAQIGDLYKILATILSDSSYANLTKLIGGEV